ncbi:condensation domain-containing protein, partial [Xanthomonas albilineans]
MPEQRTSYNVAFACHLRSADFSMSALREAIQALVARHETLRTRIATCAGGDYPSQHIADAMQVPVPCITATPAEVPRLVAEHAAHVFDLAHGPLLKVSVLRVSDDYHVFLMNMHHIICDGWSINLIFHDLRAFYIAALQQTPPALPPLLLQYADYATWQRVQDFSADLDYWKQRLHGYEEGLALPYDFPRPANRAWRAGILHLTYPDALAARLAAFSQERRVTLFMTLMASLAIVLHQYTGRRELCLGTTSAGRDQLETENLIGFFVNILAVRLNLGSHAFAEDFLQHVRQQVLDAYAHRALPFEHVLSALKKPRDSSQIPLVPIMLRHQNFATEGVNAFAQIFLSAQMEFGERTTPNELDLQFIGDGSHLEVTVEYAAELFSAATVQRMLAHHQRVLERMLEEPRCRLSDFSLPVARTEFTPHTLDTSRSVLDLFDAQVALHAEELACADQHRQLS